MARNAKQKIYKTPIIGYVLHLIESFFRLPLNNTRIKSLMMRTDELDKRLGDLSRSSSNKQDSSCSLNHHIPAFLNAIETVPALAHEVVKAKGMIDSGLKDVDKCKNDIEAIWQRLEFVRMEIMYEMRYYKNNIKEAKNESVNTCIVNSEKMFQQLNSDHGLRLNIGCGHIPVDKYINTDRRDLPGVDIIADVADLPFENGQVKEIFSSHLLEHFPQEEMSRKLLPYWYNLLEKDGVFRAITPDAEAMLSAVANGTYSYEDFRTVLFGAQEYEGDYHYNLFTPESLCDMLHKAGFTDVKIIDRARKNGRCFEFEVSARK